MNNYENTTIETTEMPVPNLSKLDSRRWQKSQYETANKHLTKHTTPQSRQSGEC